MHLSERGKQLEAAVAKLKLRPDVHFSAIRRDVRVFIAESEAGQDVERLSKSY